MACHGLSDVFKADGVTQLICDAMKPHAEVRTGETYNLFKVKSYKTQNKDGTNYFIKVHVRAEEYFHLRVYDKRPYYGETLRLTNLQKGKGEEDCIEYF